MTIFVLFVLMASAVVNCDDHFVPSMLVNMSDGSGDVGNNTMDGVMVGVRSSFTCPGGSCLNGGTCLGYLNGRIYCSCPTGYSGDNCAVRSCKPPCSINGYCNNGVCSCNPGYLPPDCKAKSNPCSPNRCPAGLRCVVNVGEYYCQSVDVCATIRCPRGTSCDRATATCKQLPVPVPTSSCVPNPCQNGCLCEPSCRHADGYFCRSPTSSYTGKTCNIDMPRISCDKNRLLVMSSAQLLQQFGNPIGMQLVLGDQYQRGPVNPTCVLTNDGSSYSISAPVNAAVCGIRTIRSSDGSMEYRTTLWLRMIRNAGFDMPVPIAMFICKYKAEFTVSTSIQPQIDIPQTINGQGEIATQGSISLCKKQNFCPNVCPAEYQVNGKAIYVVGEMLHLNIRTGTGNAQQKAAIEELFISCTGHRPADRVVSLVTSGCPATSASNYMETEITFNAKTDCVCVSFRVPQLLNCNSDRVYIHAKLADCGSRIMTTCSNFGSSSVQTCVPSVGRRRRETADPLRIFGPVYFVTLGDGESKTIMYPGKEMIPIDAVLPKDVTASQDLTPVDDFEASWDSTPVLLSVAVLFIIFCIFFACFVIYRKRFAL